MAVFAVEYTYTDDDTGRDRHRADHRTYLRSQPSLVLAGPFGDDPAGALLLFSADDEAEVARILDADPFEIHGLIAQRRVRHYVPVTGALAEHFSN
ncbi:YciI family protein [Dermacoccaceae bacterium W4C1]